MLKRCSLKLPREAHGYQGEGDVHVGFPDAQMSPVSAVKPTQLGARVRFR
jgi:hypothetical protein